MPNLFTITLNTAIDNVSIVEDFVVGESIKAISSTSFPAGKGVNAARAICCQQKNVTALGFVGKWSTSFFKSMNNQFLVTDFCSVEGNTRDNFTLLNDNQELLTHVRNEGFRITEENITTLKSNIKKRIKEGDIVILSGSIPRDAPQMIYFQLILLLKELGAKVIFDSSKIPFKLGLIAKPFAIKPNLAEFKELLDNEAIKTDEAIGYEAQRLNDYGIELVVVSLGSDGVIIAKKGVKGYWKGNLEINTQEILGEAVSYTHLTLPTTPYV